MEKRWSFHVPVREVLVPRLVGLVYTRLTSPDLLPGGPVPTRLNALVDNDAVVGPSQGLGPLEVCSMYYF